MRQGVFVLCGLAVVCASCSSGPEPPPFKAVVDNKLLMQAVVDPMADVVWDSVKTIITAKGTEDIRPKTEEEWTHVRNAAVALTESGNLLMLVPRAQDTDQWMQFASALINEGERMISAIDRRNPKDVFDIGADLYEACVHCHTNYMPGVREMYK